MSTPSLFTVELPLPDDTDRLGAALADVLIALRPQIDAAESGLAMRLEGDLGAGKTSLVRAMLRRLGWTGTVKSPTFTLLETYEAGGLKVNHFDFYRFETPEEFEDAGFADLYAAGAVCASEWSSKAAPFVPAADLLNDETVPVFTLKPGIFFFGRRWQQILCRLLQSLQSIF